MSIESTGGGNWIEFVETANPTGSKAEARHEFRGLDFRFRGSRCVVLSLLVSPGLECKDILICGLLFFFLTMVRISVDLEPRVGGISTVSVSSAGVPL